MFMQRLNPVFRFGDVRHEVDRLFEEFAIPTLPGLASCGKSLAVNVWEDSETVHVEAEVPGMTLGDIELTVIGEELTIRGERKPARAESATFHRRERGNGPFARLVSLPVPVESGRVEAILKDGVLTVMLPKAAEAKPRRIEVKTS